MSITWRPWRSIRRKFVPVFRGVAWPWEAGIIVQVGEDWEEGELVRRVWMLWLWLEEGGVGLVWL